MRDVVLKHAIDHVAVEFGQTGDFAFAGMRSGGLEEAIGDGSAGHGLIGGRVAWRDGARLDDGEGLGNAGCQQVVESSFARDGG
jgi:hypothetical protein